MMVGILSLLMLTNVVALTTNQQTDMVTVTSVESATSAAFDPFDQSIGSIDSVDLIFGGKKM